MILNSCYLSSETLSARVKGHFNSGNGGFSLSKPGKGRYAGELKMDDGAFFNLSNCTQDQLEGQIQMIQLGSLLKITIMVSLTLKNWYVDSGPS